MSLVLIGLNHRSAPVEIRERLAFSREGIATALILFRNQHPGAEAVILSTCNRVEIVAHFPENGLEATALCAFLAQVRGVPADDFVSHLYRIEGREVVAHMFRVISGMDSMVLGEYQIVNQLKQAYQLAHEQQTTGPVLHRLFHHAFGTGKRIRSDTGIADGKTSLPSVAADAIRAAMPDFASRRILIAGAGEMAQLTAQYLRDADARGIVIASRTLQNAKALADTCRGQAVPFDQLDEQLAQADVVIAATACPKAILTVDRVRRAQEARGGRPLVLIDLAVPRNIEPEAAAVPGVLLHDVDALGRTVAENARQRAAQIGMCERIIDDEVTAFEQWIAQSRVRPLIEQMYSDVRALADIEVRSVLRRCPDLTEEQRQAVEMLADRLVAKLMHPCVSAARQGGAGGPAEMLADAFRAERLNAALPQRKAVGRP